MPVGAKTHPGCDVIFVDDEQIAESGVARIVIPVKGERVMAVEPRSLGFPALVCRSYRYHGFCLSYTPDTRAVRRLTVCLRRCATVSAGHARGHTPTSVIEGESIGENACAVTVHVRQCCAHLRRCGCPCSSRSHIGDTA